MKRLLMLFAAIAVLTACNTIEIIQYEYKSTTMLGSRTLTITKDSVISSYSGRMEANRQARKTTPEEWEALKNSAKTIKLEEIRDLKSPTNKRATDAAPFGKVLLTTADSTYRSASFDGFDSHEMLKPLMEVIKEIANTVEQ
ncbi:MAG: hypothetical protein ACPG21_13365 [Crocinitomicaceae bacterium]